MIKSLLEESISLGEKKKKSKRKKSKSIGIVLVESRFVHTVWQKLSQHSLQISFHRGGATPSPTPPHLTAPVAFPVGNQLVIGGALGTVWFLLFFVRV